MITTGTGLMHRACWDERYPWRPAKTFAEVLGAQADHVLVRALLAALIPRETQRLIVRAYNTHMSERIRKSTL